MMKYITRLGWLAVLILLISSLANLIFVSKDNQQFYSIDVTGANWGKKLSIKTGSNETLNLEQYKGKVVALFFGFLSCPDFCPGHLAKMVDIKSMLGNYSNDLAVIFISVDPDRDTNDQLAKYLNSFDPDFSGAVVSSSDLQILKAEFNLVVNKVFESNSAMYTIDHYTYTYIFDKSGALRLLAPADLNGSELLSDLNQLLSS